MTINNQRIKFLTALGNSYKLILEDKEMPWGIKNYLESRQTKAKEALKEALGVKGENI